jgi:hypothetical protein
MGKVDGASAAGAAEFAKKLRLFAKIGKFANSILGIFIYANMARATTRRGSLTAVDFRLFAGELQRVEILQVYYPCAALASSSCQYCFDLASLSCHYRWLSPRCDGLDLKAGTLGDSGDLDAGAGGERRMEGAGVGVVHGGEVREVGEEHGRLDDIRKAQSSGFEDGADVRKGLFGLRSGAIGNRARVGVDGKLPGDENE